MTLDDLQTAGWTRETYDGVDFAAFWRIPPQELHRLVPTIGSPISNNPTRPLVMSRFSEPESMSLDEFCTRAPCKLIPGKIPADILIEEIDGELSGAWFVYFEEVAQQTAGEP